MDNTVLKQQDFADAVKYNHSDYELYINIYKNVYLSMRRNGLLYHSPDFSKNCVRSSAKVV